MDFNFDISLEQMKQNHDTEMKLLDLMYGGKGANGDPYKGADVYRNPLTGEITVNPNLLPETANLTDTPDTNKKIYEELTNQVSQLNEQDNTNNLRLYNNLVSRAERDNNFRETLLKGFNYGVTNDEWNRFKTDHQNNKFIQNDNTQKGLQDTPWFQSYTQNKPDDEDVNKWAYENTIVETGLGVINRKLEIGEGQVSKELGGDYKTQIDKSLANIKPVIASNGMEVTSQDMQAAIEGKNIKGITIGKETITRDYTNRGETGRQETIVRVNGQIDSRLTSLYKDVQAKNENINNKLGKKRIEIYNQLGFDREPWYFTPSDDKKPPDIVNSIKRLLPKDDKGKDLDVSVISSDFSGGIRVSVPGVKKGGGNNFTDDVIQRLRGTAGTGGVGTSIEATGDDQVTIKGTNYNVVPQAINNPILAQAAFQLSSIAETTSFAQTQPGAKVPNSDIKVPVMIRGKQQIMTIETYKNDTRPEFRVYVEGATDPRPIITASNPYELFEKIGRSPMDLNKPIR